MNREQVKRHEKVLLGAMPAVANYKSVLSRLDRQWTRATLTGKINCSRIAQTLIDFIVTTQDNFTSLQENLIDTLVFESTQKVVLEMSAVAQVAVDILKRNLFERTADVGFLATDDDIVRYLEKETFAPEEKTAIEDRLKEYRNKYTVYSEIIVLDLDGNVRAHLNADNPISRSTDPLIRETLAADEYVETYRESDLAPGQGNVLFYSQAIRLPETNAPIGVLCLLFDFEGEMEGIFEKLHQSDYIVTMILDDHGQAIASSNQGVAPIGKSYPLALDGDFRFVTIRNDIYMAKTVRTKGYQGFYGLTWYGHVLCRVCSVFQNGNGNGLNERVIRQKAIFSGRLIQVEEASENILSDLELVVQNGEIMAAKKSVQSDTSERVEAHALPHVLNEVKKIGDQVQHVFQTSTGGLLKLVTSSRLHDVEFLAQLAIDIMDRNLYERANDCRWWALNSDFRRILEKSVITKSDVEHMRGILSYINGLYTVYTNLFLYNMHGKILACSNPSERDLEGTTVGSRFIANALRITDSQLYCVSDFDSTHLYAENGASRHTYIYNASVTSIADSQNVLGGIGIVFDSEPQFESMLNDALPRDDHGETLRDSAGVFVQLDGKVVSSTNPERKAGDVIKLPPEFLQLQSGQSAAILLEEEDGLYAAGCAHSSGYREYKQDGTYTNDLLSMIKVRI